MLVHKTPEGFIIERQHWQEYFCIMVSQNVLKYEPELIRYLPWYMAKFKYDPKMGIYFYFAFPLIPIVWTLDFGTRAYWVFPRWLHRNGMLEIENGVRPDLNWLKYLKIYKIIKTKLWPTKSNDQKESKPSSPPEQVPTQDKDSNQQ